MWVDTTSYSKSAKDNTPRTYTAMFDSVRLVVSRHINCPGTWVTNSPLFDIVDLCTDDADVAKARAIALLKNYLTTALNAL